MEPSHPLPERRSQLRFAVDAEATLILVDRGATIRGRLCEISLDGCRVHADRHLSFSTPASIELLFRIHGVAFRLGGTLHWTDPQQAAGIQFSAMAERRRAALLELLTELEAEEQDKAAKEAARTAESSVTNNANGPKAELMALPGHRKGEAAPSRAAAKSMGRPISSRQPAPNPKQGPTAAAPVSYSDPAAKSAAQAVLPASGGRERRAQTRHTVDTSATVLFIAVRAQIPGRILDLSLGGCRIRTEARFPVGIYRRVEIEFKVGGLPFRLAGVVQSLHDKFTVGIRFLDMSPRKKEQLAQLMEEIEQMEEAHASANAVQESGAGTDSAGSDPSAAVQKP